MSQSENFLAFNRTGRFGRVELEVGVVYDFPAIADESLGLHEPGESDLESTREVCMTAASTGLKELLTYCFQDTPLTKTGKGMPLAIQRFCAVAFLINSGVMVSPKDGAFHSHQRISSLSTPITLDQLAEMVGCDAKTLKQLGLEFRRRWPFKAHVAKRA